ncbi:Protein of unknown function [Pyronema omphalodes CBS 100304]|uniref:Uncharacterized protein n=1 Tax=Pyronema omphalodes (strain CBS 100304) TaxID=1076935 RepID=U4LTB5_PYROM|nr:Protein of unknown function [Pyronema omphalodes CBS 100304]
MDVCALNPMHKNGWKHGDHGNYVSL